MRYLGDMECNDDMLETDGNRQGNISGRLGMIVSNKLLISILKLGEQMSKRWHKGTKALIYKT